MARSRRIEFINLCRQFKVKDLRALKTVRQDLYFAIKEKVLNDLGFKTIYKNGDLYVMLGEELVPSDHLHLRYKKNQDKFEAINKTLRVANGYVSERNCFTDFVTDVVDLKLSYEDLFNIASALFPVKAGGND